MKKKLKRKKKKQKIELKIFLIFYDILLKIERLYCLASRLFDFKYVKNIIFFCLKFLISEDPHWAGFLGDIRRYKLYNKVGQGTR